MSGFDYTFQLVDSPVDKSESGGVVSGAELVRTFHDFPFAGEIARAKEGATFPTVVFKRQSDGEQLSIWTVDDERFDLCLEKGGKKWFWNNREKTEVDDILTRFQNESLAAIHPPGLLRRIFG